MYSSFTVSFIFQTEPRWKYSLFMGGEDTRSSGRKGTVIRSRYFRKYTCFSVYFFISKVRFHWKLKIYAPFCFDLDKRKQSLVWWLIVLQRWLPFSKTHREKKNKKEGGGCDELEQGSQLSQILNYLYENRVLHADALSIVVCSAEKSFIAVISFWCWVHPWKIGISLKTSVKYADKLLSMPSQLHCTVLGWEVTSPLVLIFLLL